MNLTAKLKTWLQEHCGVAADAPEAEFRRAAAEAMTRQADADGFLSPDLLKSLQAEAAPNTPTPAPAESPLLQEIAAGQKALLDGIKGLADALKPQPAPAPTPAPATPPTTSPTPAPQPERRAPVENTDPMPTHSSMVQRALAATERFVSDNPQHKPAHTLYESTKSAAVYPAFDQRGRKHMLANMPVREELRGGGFRQLEHPSEQERAISGAWFKLMLTNGGTVPMANPSLRMSSHDWELVNYALKNCRFSGIINGGEDGGSEAPNSFAVVNRRLHEHEIKALIDDNTSGGLEIAPIFFDDAIILTPLLFGELFPLVNLVNITRGRRIEGASIGNVTLTSGGADNTTITDFNTASFVAAFDTTIYVANGGIEIGLDFMSDSPIAVADTITMEYGNRLMQWLDEQIAIGDGTTEPQGIMVASGTTAVSMGSAAPTVGEYEQLLFGVPKQFKQGFANNRIVYCANETSYRRARAMAVGTSDQRRIFGYDYSSYMLGESPYKINTSMANTQIFYANLARYRMYRRAGLVVRRTTEGKTLMSKNLMYIVARARFGGQLETGSAAAVVTDAQA